MSSQIDQKAKIFNYSNFLLSNLNYCSLLIYFHYDLYLSLCKRFIHHFSLGIASTQRSLHEHKGWQHLCVVGQSPSILHNGINSSGRQTRRRHIIGMIKLFDGHLP